MNHEPSAMHHTPPALRYMICSITLVFSIAVFYALYPRFISQVYYVKAGQYHKNGYLGLAAVNYKKAGSHQPGDAIIWQKLADVQFNMGKNKMARRSFLSTQKAKDSYLQATRHNPLDAETALGLAKTESRLEELYHRLHPNKKNNPYNPMPYFEKAIHLRPNGIFLHYIAARYLFRHNSLKELIPIVRSLSRMYPPVYNNLKKEPLWSPIVKETVKQGIVDAINQQHQLESAHRIMSSLLAEDKDWSDSIMHFHKVLEFKEDEILPQDYIHLGRLYLQNTQVEEANINFIKALYASMSIEKTFQSIGHTYKNSNHFGDFYAFYQEASRRFIFSPGMHIISARYLIDLKQYSRAQRVLMGLTQEAPTADAYYWLALIAEKEKDWDQMELNIQKATVLEPYNINYRQMFYGLLTRLGKHETAEKEIGLIIRHSDKPSPELFDQRAKLRLKRKDFFGAVEDWKEAIGLAPENASFYAQIAEAYIKLGDLSGALEYYKKVVKLNPGNNGYTKRYNTLIESKLD